MEVILPDRELDIMGVLWRCGPSTAAEVQGRLGDDLAYTTVSTILRILEDKKYVSHTAEGRTHRYSAALAREEVERGTIRRVLDRVFQGSPSLLLMQLASTVPLSPDEVQRMRQLLADHDESGNTEPRTSRSPRRKG